MNRGDCNPSDGSLMRQDHVAGGAHTLAYTASGHVIDLSSTSEVDHATCHVRRSDERNSMLNKLIRTGPIVAMVAVFNA